MTAIRVVLEVAPRKAFATALDWPGWSRGARAADAALEAVVAYVPRYAEVARRAGIPFSPPASVGELEVVERLAGGSGTEFGVPSLPASLDASGLEEDELDRHVALLQAAWTAFDDTATAAEGRQLRLGPRGGGRQVPKIVEHVRESEAAYLHQLGVKVRDHEIAAVRRAVLEAVRLRAAGEPLPHANRVRSPWTPRYAIRRSAWHALDHAWEIEDRAT